MRLYDVTYKKNDYNDETQTVWVVASTAVRASEFVSKRKYTGYSGRVVTLSEVYPTVQIAK